MKSQINLGWSFRKGITWESSLHDDTERIDLRNQHREAGAQQILSSSNYFEAVFRFIEGPPNCDHIVLFLHSKAKLPTTSTETEI